MNKHPCQAYQSGDSTRCGPCGLQWDTNDPEPPQCGKTALSVHDASLATLRKRFDLLAAAAGLSVGLAGDDMYLSGKTQQAWAWFRAGYELPR